MEPCTTLRTTCRFILTVVMGRTSSAEHLPNPETRRTRDVIFNFYPTVVRFQTRVDQRRLRYYWKMNAEIILLLLLL